MPTGRFEFLPRYAHTTLSKVLPENVVTTLHNRTTQDHLLLDFRLNGGYVFVQVAPGPRGDMSAVEGVQIRVGEEFFVR